MLTVVCSSVPGMGLDPGGWPAAAAELLRRLLDRPHRCQWIVPTKRRRRALQQEWLRRSTSSACLLPGFHTLETFVPQALQYGLRQLPSVRGPERQVRLARAWEAVRGQSAGPGLVNHLSRFVRDWQACGLPLPEESADPFLAVVRHYLLELEQDHRLDRMSSLRALTRELEEPDSWPNRFFVHALDLVCLDGFHRLEVVELELIAALSRRCDVLLWLVGVPGTPAWQTLEATVSWLGEHAQGLKVHEHQPAAAPRAALGRSLFGSATMAPMPAAPPGLFKLETDSVRAEVEAVARRIKADYREARSAGREMRLSDVAVVIPGPAYDPLVREVFPRAGLEFNLAGRALLVAASRPARLLTAALVLIRGQWRHDRLFDFLNQQLVRRHLLDSHRLGYLFRQRPRSRRRLDWQAWLTFWKQHLDHLGERVASWHNGAPIPEDSLLTREQLIARDGDLHAGASRLLASLAAVLQPLADLEAATASTNSETPLARPIDACVRLLAALRIEHWLTPPPDDSDGSALSPFNREGLAVPWVEYEKDQQAYYKLLAILKTLRDMPADRLPDACDPLAVLRLALSGETYQIRTEDDAGVQIFELREIRGLRFRHVYVLGLLDGQLPVVPEEGLLAQKRRQVPALARQLTHKEAEADYLFTQVFESATERLVLSRPVLDQEQKTLPSRYLNAVTERCPLAELPAAELICTARGLAEMAACGLAAGADSRETTLLRDCLAAWRARVGWPRRVLVDSPLLLEPLFPEQRSFSPSELETYAACPFRYFGRRILRLDERDPDQTRLHYGSLVHRVFQTFYVEMRREAGLPEEHPLPAIDARRRQRLLEIFAAEWRQLEDAMPPDLKMLFEHPQGILQLFLDIMALREKQHGNYLNEFTLPAVRLGDDSRRRPVYVTGKIDRVDLDRREMTQALVLDYKTGRPPKPGELRTKLADGRMVQLPLYAAALTRLHPELQVVGGAYVHLSDKVPDKDKGLVQVGTVAAGRKPPPPLDLEGTEKLALAMIERIRAGDFSLTQHGAGSPYPECHAYCPMRHACRHAAETNHAGPARPKESATEVSELKQVSDAS